MKKINQKEIAEYLGVSQQLICDIKKERRTFGKQNAIRIEKLTGISYKCLTFENGEGLLDELRSAYLKRGEKAK
jgi:plasmid maintenance system antidote protein VapI